MKCALKRTVPSTLGRDLELIGLTRDCLLKSDRPTSVLAGQNCFFKGYRRNCNPKLKYIHEVVSPAVKYYQKCLSRPKYYETIKILVCKLMYSSIRMLRTFRIIYYFIYIYAPSTNQVNLTVYALYYYDTMVLVITPLAPTE